MTWLPDSALSRLQDVADWPDFTGTRYEILERLGQGGMASVYRAHDRDLDRQVAVKVLHTDAVADSAKTRMLREARVIARMEHPGILPVHDLGLLPDGRIYYAMKFVHGLRLDEFLSTTQSLSDRLRVFLRICEAVAFAHSQGVIHRDLKPSNVMIGGFGEVLVIDWGLAKVLSDQTASASASPQAPPAQPMSGSEPTLHGSVLGTPGFMAPEQELGRTDAVDQRTDVFGLGALLSSLLTAASPKSLRAISDKARSADPVDRYPSVTELIDDVNNFLNGARVSAFPESLWSTGRRLVLRHRALILLVATYLAVRVVLLLVRDS
jgi:serine/threonine protein kinase